MALIRDDSAPEGPAFRVVIGPASSNVVESVAVMPAEPESETDAEVIGFAVVRALEIVEGNAAPESA